MAPLAQAAPWAARAATIGLRGPDSLPDPHRAPGTPTDALPFDHIVMVMQENHSFDNYFGMLPRRGQPAADGFTFDAAGDPTNSNPYKDGYIVVRRAASHCQAGSVSQGWKSTHGQIDGGKMDGFPANPSPSSMLYWDQADLPFYYSLATTFTVADRWFCSAPCQTYPNRRFLLAGTAFGLASTDTSKVMEDPPNGTIVDRLDAHGITWRDYYTDVPATAVIFSIPQKHPANMAPIAQFYADCAAGTLPAVSFVDSDIGAAAEGSGATVGQIPAPFAAETNKDVGSHGQSEEDPADIAYGENFVSGVVDAVLKSPAWQRILLIYTYDEHGGYYDHVPPPAAIPPDDIAPQLKTGDPPGGYDIYGPRVPAVVVSAHSRPHAVSSVVYDHTSILATIEAKWNLPALTFRDAKAAPVSDCLDFARVPFPAPPKLAAPSDIASAEQSCSVAEPTFTVHPGAPPAPAGQAPDQLAVAFYGRRHRAHGALVRLRTRSGTLKGLVVELVRGGHVLAVAHVAHVGPARHSVALRPKHGRLPAGRYTLRVRHGHRTLVSRRVRLGG